MGRQQRITYEEAVGRVTARDNERRAIFHDDVDRNRFVRVLAESMDRKWGLSLCVLRFPFYTGCIISVSVHGDHD
jgi:hypothetical protein